MIFLIAGCGQNLWSKDTQYYYVNDTLTISVAEGDMLWVGNYDDYGVYFRYNPADGIYLSFIYDTTLDAVYLNNELFSIIIEADVNNEWIDKIEAEEFHSLRSIYTELPLSETQLNSLKKISDINSNVGLFIEGDSLIQPLLSLFSPSWLVVENIDFNILPEKTKSNLNELELVWMLETDSKNLDFLYELPRLNSLMIDDWDSSAISDFQFSRLKRLRSLSITDSDIYELSALGTLPNLKDLNLIACESLTNIKSPANFKSLQSIGFTGCEDIEDISIIGEYPSLSRLSLPMNTKQEEFTDILNMQSSLQFLELFYCKNIIDLSPLVGYSDLKVLALLDSGSADLTTLHKLANLDLLLLDHTYYEDSLSLAELRNALPGTRIVPGMISGLCLGSGWILLLIPILSLLLLLKTRFRKSGFTGGRQ